MTDSSLEQLKQNINGHPATGRLKDELKNYLEARAQHTVTRLGTELGERVTQLGTPGGGGGGGLLQAVTKGGQALASGKSPAQAAMSAGKEHMKEAVKDKIKGALGKGGKGGGKSKSVVISEDIDVGVPVREAYNQWTQFQEFSTFAKGVVSVDKADDTSSNWTVKVAKSTRSWKANVTEQVPDRRITWTTEGAKGTVKGVVTFHPVTDDLTRVLLVLEYFPKGLFEKTGNIWRAQGRRARLDLKLYRKFIMMRGEAADSWRGEIRDGEVVVSHDEAVAAEEADETADPQDHDEHGSPTPAQDSDEDSDEVPDEYAYEDGDEFDEEAEDDDADSDDPEEFDDEEDEDEEDDDADYVYDDEDAAEDDPDHDYDEDEVDEAHDADRSDEADDHVGRARGRRGSTSRR
ncbi:SRPBCC family protein [Streptomyces sp. NPDC051784]|uniref:SRPBCC family protein n=1 Tax=Streptomyces sp. NPDC051784 TaxID=3155805 RepID=UPI00342F95AB